MPKRDADLLLDDIREAIGKIERYAKGFDRDAFLADDKTIDAVVRNLEVIGEAARQLPSDFVARSAGIPWHRISGLRNRIVHDYFGLDLEIIWRVVETDVPDLKAKIETEFPQ